MPDNSQIATPSDRYGRHMAVQDIPHFLTLQAKVQPMSETPACPHCRSNVTYPSEGLMNCAECGHAWDPKLESPVDPGLEVRDANGNILQDGDSVIVIKNLPVKGSPKPIKAGTKVKNIRLAEGDHNIDCRIEGFGSMGLKSEFVKKA